LLADKAATYATLTVPPGNDEVKITGGPDESPVVLPEPPPHATSTRQKTIAAVTDVNLWKEFIVLLVSIVRDISDPIAGSEDRFISRKGYRSSS
jgi:hypothetical protein